MAARHRRIHVEHEEEKRALRAEAARLRRRIDRDLTSVAQDTKYLLSWQTYVKRYPLATLGGAFAIGLGVSAAVSRTRWKQWLAGKLFSAAVTGIKTGVLTEVLSAWQRSRNGSPQPEPVEVGEHG